MRGAEEESRRIERNDHDEDECARGKSKGGVSDRPQQSIGDPILQPRSQLMSPSKLI